MADQHYGLKVGAPLFVFGAATAVGRMEENVHHLSVRGGVYDDRVRDRTYSGPTESIVTTPGSLLRHGCDRAGFLLTA